MSQHVPPTSEDRVLIEGQIQLFNRGKWKNRYGRLVAGPDGNVRVELWKLEKGQSLEDAKGPKETLQRNDFITSKSALTTFDDKKNPFCVKIKMKPGHGNLTGNSDHAWDLSFGSQSEAVEWVKHLSSRPSSTLQPGAPRGSPQVRPQTSSQTPAPIGWSCPQCGNKNPNQNDRVCSKCKAWTAPPAARRLTSVRPPTKQKGPAQKQPKRQVHGLASTRFHPTSKPLFERPEFEKSSADRSYRPKGSSEPRQTGYNSDDDDSADEADEKSEFMPKTDNPVMGAYLMLMNLGRQPQFAGRLRVPKLAFVGAQSRGKSKLVQTFLPFPCTFVAKNTGTRSPVEYSLVNDPTLSKPRIWIEEGYNPNGGSAGTSDSGFRECSAAEVRAKLGELMGLIANSPDGEYCVGGFSITPIRVRVRAPDCLNIVLLDLPGLVPGAQNVDPKRVEMVERISQRYIRDPDYEIILLRKADDALSDWSIPRINELATGPLLGRYNAAEMPPRPDWEEHTSFIVTFFDQQVADIHRTVEAHDFLESNSSKGRVTYFTSLSPKVDGDRAFETFDMNQASDDEVMDYNRKAERYELDMIENWRRKLDSDTEGPRFNADFWKPFMGVRNVKTGIHDRWWAAMQRCIVELQGTLNELIDEQKGIIRGLYEELELVDPDKLRLRYLDFLEEYREVLKLLIEYRSEVTACFNLEAYGMTYEDEMNELRQVWSKKAERWKLRKEPFDLIQASLDLPYADPDKRSDIQTVLESRLLGSAQLRRSLEMYKAMVLVAGWDPPSDSKITNFAGAMNTLVDSFDHNKAIRESVKLNLDRALQDGMDFVGEHVEWILKNLNDTITKFLLTEQGKFSYLAGHEGFLETVTEKYNGLVDEIVGNAKADLKKFLEIKALFIRTDLPDLLEEFVVRIPYYQPESGMKKPDEALQDRAARDVIREGGAEARDLSLVQLLEMRDPAPKLPSENIYDYIIRQAHKHYVTVLFLLIEDVKCIFNAEVVTLVTQRLSNRLEKTLSEALRDTEKIVSWSGVNVDSLKEKIERERRNLRELYRSRKALVQVIATLKSSKGRVTSTPGETSG